jgi:hypothetical protein
MGASITLLQCTRVPHTRSALYAVRIVCCICPCRVLPTDAGLLPALMQRAAEMLIDKFNLVLKALDMFEKVRRQTVPGRAERGVQKGRRPTQTQTDRHARTLHMNITNH